jgi:hypothetical protein
MLTTDGLASLGAPIDHWGVELSPLVVSTQVGPAVIW